MYKLSKDYVRAYKDLHRGGFLICFVDYRFRCSDEKEDPYRDLCKCKLKNTEIDFSIRGMSYGSVDISTEESEHIRCKKFMRMCESLNMSFITF